MHGSLILLRFEVLQKGMPLGAVILPVLQVTIFILDHPSLCDPLQKGVPLGAVNLLVLPVVVGCTSLVTALGVTALAAHTIVKQV